MLAECSRVAITMDVEAIPIPAGAPLERWLLTFPSFGYLLSAKPDSSTRSCRASSARHRRGRDRRGQRGNKRGHSRPLRPRNGLGLRGSSP